MQKKPIERLEEIKNIKKLTNSSLDAVCGLSNGAIGTAFKRKSSLKDETLIAILDNFPDINCEWLLMGEGEMLKKDDYYVDRSNKVQEEPVNYTQSTKILLETIEGLNKDKSFLQKQIDFLNEELSSCLENKKNNAQAS